MNSSRFQSVSPAAVIKSPGGYIWLMFLSMTYMSFLLFNAILTNRYIGSNHLYILGGTLTSPFVFLIDNIVAEIYGYRMTRNMILSGMAVQTGFIFLSQFILSLPQPDFALINTSYNEILGASLVRIHVSGCFAYLLAMIFNTKIITRWKVLLNGKKFWLRSIGSSSAAEALYSIIAILLMEIQSIPTKYVFKIILISYFIKIAYNVSLALPLQYLVRYIRKSTGIDIYDFNHDFTPSKYYTKIGMMRNDQ